jgi:hypothetical protein
MTYPAKFTPYPWQDLPSESTPFDKELANEVEERFAEFVEAYEFHWRAPVEKVSDIASTYKAKGTNVAVGDVVLVWETRELYVYTEGEEWKPLLAPTAHWLAPVEEYEELPAGENGDVCLVESFRQLFVYTGTWQELIGGYAHTIESPTWVVAGEVSVGVIPGPFIKVHTSEVQHVRGAKASLAEGKIVATLLRNGTPISAELEEVKIEAGEPFEVTLGGGGVQIISGDQLTFEIVSLEEEPSKGLAFTAFVEHESEVG